MTFAFIGGHVVGDELVRRVGHGAIGPQILVHLIDGLNGFGFFQIGVYIGRAAFGVTVVHHGHSWLDSAHDDWIVAGIESMMRNLVHIHRSDEIERVYQLSFLIPSQVACVEEAKVTQREQHHDRVGIVATVTIFRAMLTADLTIVARADQLGVDKLFARAQAKQLQGWPGR